MNGVDVILADRPGLGRVRLCACNTIHLNIGPVTINLSPEDFAQAAILMRNAMEQLHELDASRQPEANPLLPRQSLTRQLTH